MDTQVEQGLSLDAQQAKLTACADLYELDLVTLEVDAGISTKTLQRLALQRALAWLKAEEAEALLVVKLDCLTRSVRDLWALVETYFLPRKWSLMSVSEQIDTRTAAGRMVLHILAAVSQWERETIGERTAEAMAYKRRRREYTGGESPLRLAVTKEASWTGRHLARCSWPPSTWSAPGHKVKTADDDRR